MLRSLLLPFASVLAVSAAALPPADAPSTLTVGRPEIRSLSALAFAPDGTLFVGDSKGGAVFALDLGARPTRPVDKPQEVADVEGKLAALLGTTPADVMVHDLAVDPLSKRAYLAVSRGRAAWNMQWLLPNDVADATALVRLDEQGRPELVDPASLRVARAELPRPVDAAKKVPWKDVSLRADTVTDMAFSGGTLYVAGLSNEEFAATLWRVPYPFGGPATLTTLENFHGAHGKYETESPIRTFVPYTLKGVPHLLAAYLCTPLVTFPLDGLGDRRHVRGRTLAEFGSGNYPLDMVVYRKAGREKLLIANSNLPLMIVDPKDIEAFDGAIVARPEGYTAGVRYEARPGSGIQQLDNLGESHVLVLRRLPGGRLDLVPVPVERF